MVQWNCSRTGLGEDWGGGGLFAEVRSGNFLTVLRRKMVSQSHYLQRSVHVILGNECWGLDHTEQSYERNCVSLNLWRKWWRLQSKNVSLLFPFPVLLPRGKFCIRQEFHCWTRAVVWKPNEVHMISNGIVCVLIKFDVYLLYLQIYCPILKLLRQFITYIFLILILLTC